MAQLDRPKQTVLVIGGAGFIGSQTCKALAAAGFLPVTVDDLSGGHEWAVKWGPLERCDIRDHAALDRVFRLHRPTAVLHFAGLIAVGESMERPGRYYDSNVGGTLALLEAMRDAGCGRLVFSSSAAVYGVPEATPIPETHSLRPINPYGRTKAIAEGMAADFAAAHGLASAALRYFNAAGADPDGELGEAHDPETHLIPLALEAAAGLRPALSLFGEDFPTRDGTCVRDYVHVADLADAHVLALKALVDGKQGADAYNLGNGAGFTVREVIDAVETVTGAKLPVRTAPRRPGDPAILLADAKRAGSELGWRPRFASLHTQVLHAWSWQMKRTMGR